MRFRLLIRKGTNLISRRECNIAIGDAQIGDGVRQGAGRDIGVKHGERIAGCVGAERFSATLVPLAIRHDWQCGEWRPGQRGKCPGSGSRLNPSMDVMLPLLSSPKL